MQKLISSLQHFFTPVSRPGEIGIDKNSMPAPNIKSLATHKSSPEDYSMSEIKHHSPRMNNNATRSGIHHSDVTPPTYRASMEDSEEAPEISADTFFQYIERDEIGLLQSGIEAGFLCDETYEISGKSMTPFQCALWQGNVEALKVLFPHTGRNYIVLAFSRAYEDACREELCKILPAAKEVIAVLKEQPEMKNPLAQCVNFIYRIEARL